MDKENVVHIQNGILCTHEKTEVMSFATAWLSLEHTMLSIITKVQEDMLCMLSFMYRI
jgi:hypothetical protein